MFQCKGQLPSAKNYPAKNVTRAEAEKPCIQQAYKNLLEK